MLKDRGAVIWSVLRNELIANRDCSLSEVCGESEAVKIGENSGEKFIGFWTVPIGVKEVNYRINGVIHPKLGKKFHCAGGAEVLSKGKPICRVVLTELNGKGIKFVVKPDAVDEEELVVDGESGKF